MILFGKLRNKEKIFCVSFQRTGTTSVGKFFNQFGYRVAPNDLSYKNLWGYKWYKGDFRSILNSWDFRNNDVFEDGPWFFPDFYKYLFQEMPKAKFILFTRDPDRWFDSMMSHSNGMNLGNSFVHAKVYRRENYLYQLLAREYPEIGYTEARNLIPLDGMRNHYKDIYSLHNREVKEYFMHNSPSSLFSCKLEDQGKWQKLGKYMGIDVPEKFDIHANKSIPIKTS